jgi:hypothetical protein
MESFVPQDAQCGNRGLKAEVIVATESCILGSGSIQCVNTGSRREPCSRSRKRPQVAVERARSCILCINIIALPVEWHGCSGDSKEKDHDRK